MLDSIRKISLYICSLIMAIGAVYVAGFGVFDEIILRGSMVGIAALIMILSIDRNSSVNQAKTTSSRRKILVGIDFLLIVATVVAILMWIYQMLEREVTFLDFEPIDLAYGAVGVLVIFELTRRSFGIPMLSVCLIAVVYVLFGSGLPGMLEHSGFELGETIEAMWYSSDGVFGRPLAVVTQIVLVFIVFGVILEGAGAGDVLLKMAFAATSRLAGGPAHAAIVASALFGTMSGSVIANVVSTGVFTIPVIKRRGFSNKFAGAVESAASTGGQIMPPIMGVVAFLMADVTGISYLTIVVAAIMPAIFYYGSLFATVVVESRKLGLKPIARSEQEPLTSQDWIRSAIFIVPLIMMVAILITGRTAALAGFWASVAALVLGLVLNPDFRRSPKNILDTLARAGRTSASIIIVVGAIGLVIGVVNMTGIGQRFAELILTLSGESLMLSLLVVMVGCLILGMGLPTGAAYLIIVLVIGPALGKLGVSLLVAHLFVVYYGVLSAVTPPVALAAFSAAPICGARPMETAVESVRLSVVGFFIPFVFVYYPSLLLVESFDTMEFIWVTIRMMIAIWFVATGLGGFNKAAISAMERVLRLAVAAALLSTNLYIAVLALAIAIGMTYLGRLNTAREGAA